MTIPNWVKIGVAVVVLSLLALAGYELVQEHDARVKAEATVAATQKNIDDAKKDAAAVQSDLAMRLAALERQKQAPATAPQIVIDAQKLFPNLPQQLQVVQHPPVQTVVDGKMVETPSAPVVQIPQVDFQTLQNGAIAYQENDAKLTACNLTAADTQKELADTATERDAYKAALKGGTFWQRLKHDAKTIGITAAIAGGVAYAAGRKGK
jgi:apolipoprotein N-acyltransferase